MSPTQLSYESRLEQSDDLNRQRWLVVLSVLGVTFGQVVSLYQLDIVKHLPDLPIPYIDSDKVDVSAYTYKRFDMPMRY